MNVIVNVNVCAVQVHEEDEVVCLAKVKVPSLLFVAVPVNLSVAW